MNSSLLYIDSEIKDLNFPKVYQEFYDNWNSKKQREKSLQLYQQKKLSFVPNLLPEQALSLSTREVLDILENRLGNKLNIALANFDPNLTSADLPDEIKTPVRHFENSNWIKSTNMLGINVRTIGSFWNIIKYVLTLPKVQDSIHFLPIWEAGVVGSIYGISSWQLNHEFYSIELEEILPELNTLERQLKVVINILHVMGKKVGMDVIPHTDRYSQIVIASPQYFEWLQRQDTVIISHREHLHEEVQEKILQFLKTRGPAIPKDEFPETKEEFFGPSFTENDRMRVLFGLPQTHRDRSRRRSLIVKYLCSYGYEPVPSTMAPPFRGLKVDVHQDAIIFDNNGNTWRDYKIKNPTGMSRVFGPLTRYKLYNRVDHNSNWEIDFGSVRREVWDYVCEHYFNMQNRYGFDFMRGDMSHVQMRPNGVPAKVDQYYDLLGAIKNYIQEKGSPYFGYMAETFLPFRDVFGYGEEIDHLEASDADSTLGNLQSTCVGSREFLCKFHKYYDYLAVRSCVPCFTMMTSDKDDPRFDEYYRKGSILRLFIGFFLGDMPTYNALGFETRDIHYSPATNEHYTKLYVLQENTGPKATLGPYIWGKNGHLYKKVTQLRICLDNIWDDIVTKGTKWLIHPDPLGANKVIAWTQQKQPKYLFVANSETEKDSGYFAIPFIPGIAKNKKLRLVYSTQIHNVKDDKYLLSNGKHYRMENMKPGEGRIYSLE